MMIAGSSRSFSRIDSSRDMTYLSVER